MKIYYSEPIAKGTYNSIVAPSGTTHSLEELFIDLTIVDYNGWLDLASVFSSGILSGDIVSVVGNTIRISVSKDSFVTLTALNDFIDKHSGISYNFEVLRGWNAINGSDNAVISDIMVNTKKRINNYSNYSPHSFNYNKDFYYEIETKTITLRDGAQIDDLLRASSFVLRAEDESVVRYALLDDTPDVIGISGDTAGIVSQPYFGGLQNNIYYRATMIGNEFHLGYG